MYSFKLKMKNRNCYLSVDWQEEQDICLLCEKKIQDTADVQGFTKLCWDTLQTLAKEWASARIKEDATNFTFKRVYSKIKDKEAFGKVHSFL